MIDYTKLISWTGPLKKSMFFCLYNNNFLKDFGVGLGVGFDRDLTSTLMMSTIYPRPKGAWLPNIHEAQPKQYLLKTGD